MCYARWRIKLTCTSWDTAQKSQAFYKHKYSTNTESISGFAIWEGNQRGREPLLLVTLENNKVLGSETDGNIIADLEIN